MLEKRRRIFDEKHFFIILTMNNLVFTFEDQGQLKKATTIIKKMLKKRKRILGEKHLDTRSIAKILRILINMRNA